MTPRRRIAAGSLRWLALILSILGAFLVVERPGLVAGILAGLLGPARYASIAILLVAAALGITAFLLTPHPNRNRRRIALAVVAAMAIPLAGLQAMRVATGFKTETVKYTSADGTPLVASLYLPRTRAPHPAIVIVHGSAKLRRAAYDVWAVRLVEQGFAVLLADKRGVGNSGGIFDNDNNTGEENIQRLTSDVVAGVAALASRADIDSTRIGLLGVSQAGWVAPAAAVADTRVHFMVLITGPTVSTREEGKWSKLRGDDEKASLYSVRDAEQIIDTVQSKGVDARTWLKQLRIPAFWLFGANDNSIPSRKSIRVLDSLKAAGAPFSWRLYAGYGHALIGRGPNGILPRLSPEGFRDIEAWLEPMRK